MNPQTYTSPQWHYARLIDMLKPYSNIVARLEAKGYPRLPLSSVAGWRMRNSIPAPWVPAMIDLGLETRIIGNIEDLRLKPENQHAPAEGDTASPF